MDATQSDPNGATLGWDYDRAGQLTGLRMPGASIGYEHDAGGRVTSQTSPWGSLAYSYDPVGNLLTEARSSGVTTRNTYDLLGRVTSISHQTPVLPDATQATSRVAAWDGRQAFSGDVSSCPAGTGTNPDRGSTAQVSSYLGKRTAPGTAIAGCEKTAAYAAGRGLPTPGEVFAAGDALRFSYGYDGAGNVTFETQDRGSFGTVSTGFSYDGLSRLTGSTSTGGGGGVAGGSNSYRYDKVGNRTGWSTTKAPDTGAPLSVAASFNKAGQLTAETRSRPKGSTSVGYSYDNAGQRTGQTSSGPDGSAALSYGYTGAGRLASTTQDGSTTRVGYDGMGRALTSTTTSTSTSGTGSGHSTQATSSVWAGTSVVQQVSDTGTSTMVRDALGQVALQSRTVRDTSAAPAWLLQDRLGSTVAQTTAQGRITDLASYSDFGVPTFDSTGFAATTGFTGELTDAGTGLNSYFSRTYDPMAATWLSADSYRGTLTDPASQHRYGYVGGNPITHSDHLGFSSRAIIDGSRRPPPPSISAHTADGWERLLAANPTARTPINSGSTHIPARHVQGTLGAASPINKSDLSGGAICAGDGDVGCNIGMNIASIFVGIGDSVTLCPLCLIGGEMSLTGLIRNAIGGQSAASAAAKIQSNGFYTFGSLWAGAAVGAVSAPAGLGSRIAGVDSKLFGNYKMGTPNVPAKPGGLLNRQGATTKIGWSTDKGNAVFRISAKWFPMNVNKQGYGHLDIWRPR